MYGDGAYTGGCTYFLRGEFFRESTKECAATCHDPGGETLHN
jgi:hypothetical protein